MVKPVVEDLENGDANIFFRGMKWRRTDLDGENGPFPWWQKVSLESGEKHSVKAKYNRTLEEVYDSYGSDERELRRFPRLGVTDEYAGLFGIPTIGDIESSSHTWLVEGLISQGTVNLLTAPPGGYKTWLALWLARCVSLGKPFLDRQTAKTEVLYLDNENPASVIRQRRKMLDLDSESFRVWGHWWKRLPMINDARLLGLAQRHRPFIIFDSFLRFHTADENSSRQMARVFKRLRRIADTGSTVFLLHHQAKTQGSLYRGSTDILAGVDAAFELSRPKKKEDTTLILNCFKHRRKTEMSITMNLDLEKGRFDAIDDPSTVVSAKLIEKIQSVIAKNPQITQKQLMEKAELPETNGRKILLRGDGRHWLAKRGKGTTLHYYPKS